MSAQTSNSQASRKQLLFFRPAEVSTGFPGWQFGLHSTGRCGATIKYPIEGYTIRHHREKTMEATLDAFTVEAIFNEIAKMPENMPSECLPHEVLWADMSEQANNITRDRETNTLCYYISIINLDNNNSKYAYWMREDSAALMNSITYKLISGLLAPYLER